MTEPDTTPRFRRPRWRGALLGVVALALAGWSGAWWLASRQAGAAVDAWLAEEQAEGRQWTCPARHLGGFPFAIKLRCDKPAFRGEVMGRLADGTVEGLVAGWRLGDPAVLTVALKGPLNLRSEAEDFDLALSWDALSLAVRGVLSGVPAGGLSARRLAATLQTAAQGDLNLRLAALDATGAPDPREPADVAFSFDADGASFPTLEAWPGLDGPAKVSGQGVLTEAAFLRAPTRAALEAWRRAGGALRLSSLDMRKGAFHGTARGSLTLDEAHRPAGALQSTLAGFEPIAERLGIPAAGVQLGGILSELLGGGGKAAPRAEAGAVRMQLVLADGALSVGPVRTGVRLEPLY